jgi:hypothetical protein
MCANQASTMLDMSAALCRLGWVEFEVAKLEMCRQSSEDRRLAEMGVCRNRPMNADMANHQTRLGTYTTDIWPVDTQPSPDALAAAGFFALGSGDRVKCFHCWWNSRDIFHFNLGNGGLQHWSTNDVPFVEHAKYFPTCAYVRLCKGDDFVRRVQQAPPTSPSSVIVSPA